MENLKDKVLAGSLISKEEAMSLINEDCDVLGRAANEIRKYFCGRKFDLCSVISGRIGKCSEDCKFCAQSGHYNGECRVQSMISYEDFKDDAISNYKIGINRYGVVSAGKRITDAEVDMLCDSYSKLKKECNISICGYGGILPYESIVKLRDAGITRYHNNLETSRRVFKTVCTTHTYDEKLRTLKYAKKAGLEICSGCLLGIGENMEDRIEMAFDLQKLEVDSVPINILAPKKGTPFENAKKVSYEEIIKTIAIFRFILPKAQIRLAAGRLNLEDKGRKCFESGANAAISGNMITIDGVEPEEDIKNLRNYIR